ncbi:VC0807 family protein [Nocardioides sp. KR10-350]|uniref:VC0807 family protein n=1 Tax=Nocardioides cheoyonin TaxID=3156615 RepID=UPI0032B3CABB
MTHHASLPTEHLIELGHVGKVIRNALLLLGETVVVPTVILYGCMQTVGTVPGLIGVIAWCAFTMAVRWVRGSRVPSTLLLVVGILVVRTGIALAASSVWLFLLQPIAASVLMAVVFVGSALLGRPITQKLAQDFIHLPERLLADRRMQRIFIEVALIWGFTRVLDAGISLNSLLSWGADAGVLVRGILSVGLTALSVAGCAYWGWRRIHRIPGVRFRFGVPVTTTPAA